MKCILKFFLQSALGMVITIPIIYCQIKYISHYILTIR